MQIVIKDKNTQEEFNEVKRSLHITNNIAVLQHLIGLYKEQKEKGVKLQ